MLNTESGSLAKTDRNMKYIRNIFIVMLLSLVSSCVEKDYFGESTEANILTFEIDKQMSCVIKPYVDWQDTGLVSVVMPANANLSNLKVNYVTFSQLAYPSSDILKLTNFSDTVLIDVTAENTLIKKAWRIVVKHEKQPVDPEDPDNKPKEQLEFSSMTQWTNAVDKNGKNIKLGSGEFAYTPGSGTAFTPWATTAEANALTVSKINFFTTQPYPNYSQAQYARMETLEVDVAYLKNLKSAIVAGALFTGKFIFELKYGIPDATGTSYPRKMLDFGVPFRSKPKSVTFKMRYAPGQNMKDGALVPIVPSASETRATKDSCDIYFILQNRDGDKQAPVRVAAAWLRTSDLIGNINDDNNGFVEKTVEFVYGRPSAEQLNEKPYLKIGGVRGELSFYSFPLTTTSVPMVESYATEPENIDVTNIIVMFSSSAYGDKFWAASNPAGSPTRGSTLDIKDMVFNY